MLSYSFIFSLLVAGSFATTTETPAKSEIDAQNTNGQKSAASLDEQNKVRTLHNKFNKLKGQYLPSSSHLASILNTPLAQSLFAPANAAPVGSAQIAPFQQASAPVNLAAAPIHLAQRPVMPQTLFTKPVVSNPPTAIKKPPYPFSQQVLHQPVITDVQQIIRSPVIAELQHVIHKPMFVEYQQAIKLPTYTLHVVKKPTYSPAVQHETVQKPVLLQSQPFHVVEKPSSQLLQLPPQYMQPPFTTGMVSMPSIPNPTQTQATLPAVSLPAIKPTLPVIPPAIKPTLPALSFPPSGSSFGGFGNYGYPDAAGYYVSPATTCRGGDCLVKRHADDREIIVVPRSDYANLQMMPTSFSSYNNPNVMPATTISMPQMYWPEYYQSVESTQAGGNSQQDGSNSQQPSPVRDGNEFGDIYLSQGFENDLPYQDEVIPKFAEKLLSNPEFQKIVLTTFEKVRTEVRSAENENKLSAIIKSLTPEQVNTLIEKMPKEQVTEVESSSTTTPASIQPTVDQNTEAPKTKA